jgi:LPXTG-motif cell wall-anchored protein
VLSSDRDHDGRADRGDGVRVVAVVTNSGEVTLRSVRVTDALVKRLGGSVRCGTTVLARGASTTCTSGSVQVTRTQAKAGVLTNQVTANARTAAGKLIRSATSTARLQVQKPVRKHGHHKHGHKKGHHKHRHHKHAQRKHHHRHAHQHRQHHHHKAAKPTAKLGLTQFVLSVSDKNKNGRLEAGDSIRFGFKVTKTGTLTVDGIHIVGRRLTRFKVPVACAASELAPGATTACTSGGLPITRYQAKKRLGSNFAYAAGTTTGGTAVRSNSTVIVLGRSTERLTHLPNTGSDVTRTELGAVGLLLVGGVLVLVLGRRRRWSRVPSPAPTSSS